MSKSIRQILEDLVHLPYDAHQKDIDKALSEIQEVLNGCKPDYLYSASSKAVDKFQQNIKEAMK